MVQKQIPLNPTGKQEQFDIRFLKLFGEGTELLKPISSTINRTLARVYLGSNQSVNSGSITKLNLNTISFDAGKNFDTTNYKFVAPIRGYYNIMASAGIESPADGTTFTVKVYVNGAAYSTITTIIGAGSATPVVHLCDIAALEMNDTVELYAEHNHGSARNIIGSESTTKLVITLMSLLK